MIFINIKKPTQHKSLTNAGPKQKTKTSSQLLILIKFTVYEGQETVLRPEYLHVLDNAT